MESKMPKHPLLLGALAALVFCGCRTTVTTPVVDSSTLADCATALMACDDGDDLGVIGEVGDLDREDRDRIERAGMVPDTAGQGLLSYYEKYRQFVMAHPASPTDPITDAEPGTEAFYRDYVNSLTNFFRQEKATHGQLSSDYAHIAQELGWGVVQMNAASGQETIVKDIQIKVVETGSTQDGVQDTHSLTGTVGINIAPGGVGATGSGQASSSRASTHGTTRKDNDVVIEIEVTHMIPGGDPIPQTLIFELADSPRANAAPLPPLLALADGPGHGGIDRSDIRQQQLERQEALEAEAARQRAEAAQRALEAYLASLVEVHGTYRYSDLDGKYHLVDREQKKAYAFLDNAWRGSATPLNRELDAAAGALTKAAKALLASQARAAGAIARAKAGIGALAATPASLAEVRQVMNDALPDACEQAALGAQRRRVTRQIPKARALGKRAASAIDQLRPLQKVAHIEAVLAKDTAKIDAAAKTLDRYAAVAPNAQQCKDLVQLFAALSKTSARQAVQAATNATRTLLEQLSESVRQEADARAADELRRSLRAAVLPLSQALYDAWADDSLSRANDAAEDIAFELANLGSRLDDSPATDAAKAQIRAEIEASLNQALADWRAYSSRIPAAQMLELHARFVDKRLAVLRRQVEAAGDEAAWWAWLDRLTGEGINLTGICFQPHARFEDHCWRVRRPLEATPEALVEFDRKLARIEAAAAALQLPTPAS
jgi:hypothetical protein